jgi:hypothetical protein
VEEDDGRCVAAASFVVADGQTGAGFNTHGFILAGALRPR